MNPEIKVIKSIIDDSYDMGALHMLDKLQETVDRVYLRGGDSVNLTAAVARFILNERSKIKELKGTNSGVSTGKQKAS